MQQFNGQVANITTIANSVQQSFTAARRVFEVLDAPAERIEAMIRERPSSPRCEDTCEGGRRPGTNDLTASAGKGTTVRVDPVRFIANEGSVTVIDLASGSVKANISTFVNWCTR